MKQSDQRILDDIKGWVWSGFYTPTEVNAMLNDLLEDDSDEEALRAAIRPEFEKKAAAEATWPEITDCDRLDQAFHELNSRGIIALHNAGYTMSDGADDVSEILHERGKAGINGSCFYHAQDVEGAIAGKGLLIAFIDDFDGNPTKQAEIGQIIKEVCERFGFTVEWNGKPEKRIFLPNFDWKRRGPV